MLSVLHYLGDLRKTILLEYMAHTAICKNKWSVIMPENQNVEN